MLVLFLLVPVITLQCSIQLKNWLTFKTKVSFFTGNETLVTHANSLPNSLSVIKIDINLNSKELEELDLGNVKYIFLTEKVTTIFIVIF